jgi:hypothetical protein
LLKLCSHFFQVLDLAIDRGFWPAATREYHHRDKEVPTLPELKTYDDALEWSGYILAGETKRQSDEGAAFTPMSLPTTGEIQSALTTLQTAMGAHTGHKSALQNAQLAVDALLPENAGIDKLLLDLYNDVENYYRDYPDATRRDAAREWGILYTGDPVSGGSGGPGGGGGSSGDPLTVLAIGGLVYNSSGPSMQVNYATTGGETATALTLIWRQEGGAEVRLPLTRPSQEVALPGFNGVVTYWKAEVTDGTTTLTSPELTYYVE